jgi:hypothetical protein
MEIEYDTASLDRAGELEELNRELPMEELREKFKQELLSVATDLLLEYGFGGMKKGRLYGMMMDHVIKKIFKGKPLSEADRNDIEFAMSCAQQIRKNLTRPIVAGILDGGQFSGR